MAVYSLPLDFELTVYNWTTFRKSFRWLPDGNTTPDFTGWSASMLIGETHAETAVLSLTDANGGIVLDNDCYIVIVISPTQTASLPGGVMSYSLDLTDTSGTIQRFMRGRLSVVIDVGRSA